MRREEKIEGREREGERNEEGREDKREIWRGWRRGKGELKDMRGDMV